MKNSLEAVSLRAIVAGIATFGLATAAHAQADETPAVVAENVNQPATGINQIVVTARKSEERLQDVPLAISAFGERDLEKLGITGAADIGSFTPGLLFEKDFGRRFDRPVIRGQSNILGAANAASFIDGVFIPDSLFSTELGFVERVEVIKGPQSALYGRQTFSGAISYITKRPSDFQESELRVRVAEDDELDVLALLSGPLIGDSVKYQIGANFYTYGGQYRNNAPGDPSDGRKIGGEETIAVSGKLLLEPTDNLDVTLRASYSRNDDEHETIALQDSTFNNCFRDVGRQYFCGEVDISPESIGLNLDAVDGGGISRETIRLAATAEYEFDSGYTFTSITGYNDSSEERKFDADFQNFAGFLGTLHVNDMVDIESFSQEIRLASPTFDRFRWLVGLYYFEEERNEDRFRYVNSTLLDNPVNLTENLAAFAFASYDITDQLSVTAEVRYAEDRLELAAGATTPALKQTFASTTPRVTLSYAAQEDLLIYGVVAKGNKPGGFNSDQRLPGDLVAYDEETAWNYEVGVKTTIADTVQINLAGYYIDWTNQQLTQNFLPTGGSPFSYIDNAGSLDVWGGEIEASIFVTPDWSIRTSYAFTDPVFNGGTDEEVGTLFGDPSLVGRRPPNVARHQLSAISDFNFALSDQWSAYFVADANYRSSKYAQLINEAETGPRTVANARIGVTDDTYELALFARNIFNNIEPVTITRYIDSRNFIGSPFRTNRGFLAGIPRGRQIGAEVRVKY